MSYYGAPTGERGILTDQFSNEPTGYRDMGATLRSGAPPLATPMPRVTVQRTPALVGQRVIRRAAAVVVPRTQRQLTAPRPTAYRGTGLKVRPLGPRERLRVRARPLVAPPPQIILPQTIPPGPPLAPQPPPSTAPPLPDDLDFSDPHGFDIDALISEAEGGDALEEMEAEAAVAAPPPKKFPWKTVGIVAAAATALYLIGRK